MADVKLHRPGWTDYNWAPHGMSIPVRFDSDDSATVDADVFDEWIGDDKARAMGIVVTRPKPPVTKAATKKKTPKPTAKK